MAAGRQTEGGLSTMLVGIANPETIEALMDLARCLAGYADYNVIATHILVVPPQAHLGSARGSAEMAKARQLLLDAIREGAGEEVPVKGVVEVAREVSEGLVSAAETQEVSLILVGHSERAEEDEAAGKRFDRVMHQVARETEADLVVAKFRRDQIGSILL
ncbi:MAG: universal stress protein, partial [Armatimonadota bacterium]